LIHKGTYDGTIYHNPANKFCIISVKTADQDVPQEARSTRRYKDHLIRFVATGYELPRTDAVELELDGEWKKGKYGMQLQVEQWHEIVPRTKGGVEGYLASGLIKGIGPATAAQIVSRFGVETLDILQNHPERLLEIKGITEGKLEDIKTSYAESRMLQDLMTLLSPFKITPKTAQKIYQYFGPASVDILKKSPFELCQVSGFGFLRVDAIVQKNGGDLHDPMRIKGALFWALEDSKGSKGHLFLTSEVLRKEALRVLNAKIPIPSLRLHEQEVIDVLQNMILHGEIVAVSEKIYLPRVFAQEDETARQIAMRVVEPSTPERIEQILERVKREMGLALSSKQEAAVHAAYRHNLSIITGSPGTGKTTVLKTILEVYRRLYPNGEIVLMAPTGRASRRMAESTGVDKARTLHSGLGLASEEEDVRRSNTQEPLSADLIIVDEFSMVDMWLANKFFSRIKEGARIVLVGDPDQLPSVGAGNVFRELIDCGLITVTVLDQIFRQSKDSLIAYNAKFINEGNTKLYYGQDFIFMASDNQTEAAERIVSRYCREIEESGIDRVQILSPFRSEGAASAEQLNEAIREVVNPFRSAEEEIKVGVKVFRVNDRIMQTKNTAKVSNGDLGFIRYIRNDEKGAHVGLDFGAGREMEYSIEDMVNLDLAYATTIHKAMGSEYETVIMPLLKAHTVMLYRNLLYTGITRAKKRVILIGQKQVLFMAIHRNEIGKRNTLLGERIRLYYKAYARRAGIPIPAAIEKELKHAG
jgi:exodeoxyribonuclease V alpha subunit